ncbi:MAG TPA: hypothetical protein VJ123_04480 [Anaerolineales bacterium]|nr:hypothetical protein [Anaerolineales bacterium]
MDELPLSQRLGISHDAVLEVHLLVNRPGVQAPFTVNAPIHGTFTLPEV